MKKMIRRSICMLISFLMIFSYVPLIYRNITYAADDLLGLDKTEVTIPLGLIGSVDIHASPSFDYGEYSSEISGDSDLINVSREGDFFSISIKNGNLKTGTSYVKINYSGFSKSETAVCKVNVIEGFSKYAAWTGPKNADICLESLVNREMMGNTPKVLFLGSVCSAHDLLDDTVKNALNAITRYANVDYFMYGMNTYLESGYEIYENQLYKGSTLNSNPVSLENGTHVSQYYFVDVINYLESENLLKTYDLIILEFDGLRWGVQDFDKLGGKNNLIDILNQNYYENTELSTKVTRTPVENYAQVLDKFKSASDALESFYDQKKVVWILPEINKGDSFGGDILYDDKTLDFKKEDVYSYFKNYAFDSLALVSPKDFKKYNRKSPDGYYSIKTDTNGEWILDTSIETSSIKNSDTDYYRMGKSKSYAQSGSDESMWENYTNSGNVSELVGKKAASITHYKNIEMEDTVSEGLDIVSVSAQYQDENGNWKEIKNHSDIIFRFTTDTDNPNHVTGYFDLTALNSDENYHKDNKYYEIVKMTIKVKTNDKISYVKKNNQSVVPTNEGNATVIYDGNTRFKQKVSTPYLNENKITVTKTADKEEVRPNETVKFTITVKNDSVYPVTNLKVYDELNPGNPIEVGKLGPGESKTIEQTYKVPSGLEETFLISSVHAEGTLLGGTITATDILSITYTNLYKITTDHAGEGTISSSTDVSYGENPKVTYSPNKGWNIESITVDGKSVDPDKNPNFYTFKNVMKDHNIKVVFTQSDYDIIYEFIGSILPSEAKVPDKESNVHFGDSKRVDLDPQVYPGYQFSGWRTNDAVLSGTDFTMPDHDVHFTGSFTLDNFRIYYQFEGDSPSGANAPIDTTSYHVNDRARVLNATQFDGWTFLGWTSTDVTLSDGEFSMPAKDVTFVGKWSKDPVITFKVNDPTLGSIDNPGGPLHDPDTKSIPSTVTLNTGVKLDHWENKSGTNVGNDLTLYATPSVDGWKDETYTAILEKIPYKVSYVYAGKTPSDVPALPDEKTYTYEELVSLEHNAPDTNGYSFTGWVISDTDIKANDFGLFTMPAKDLIVVGRWEKIPEITYESNHPDLGTVSRDFETFGPDKPFALGSLAEPIIGNKFVAWVKSGTDEIVSTKTNLVPKKTGDKWEDAKYIACFEPIDYMITYKYAGDLIPSGAMALLPNPTDANHAGEDKKVSSAPSIQGYIFSGWTTKDVLVSGTDFTMPAKDVHFVGSWKEISHVVIKYQSEDIMVGKVSHTEDDFNPETDSPDSSKAVAKDGYHFVKWIDEYGKTISIKEKLRLTTPTDGWKNATYTAVFAPDEYKISYAYEGSLIPEGANKLLPSTTIHNTVDSKKVVEDVPVIKGYIFKGWNTGDVTVKDGKFTMPAHDVKFVGVWEKEEENPNTGAPVFGNIILP